MMPFLDKMEKVFFHVLGTSSLKYLLGSLSAFNSVFIRAKIHGVHPRCSRTWCTGHELGTQKRALFEPAYDQMGG